MLTLDRSYYHTYQRHDVEAFTLGRCSKRWVWLLDPEIFPNIPRSTLQACLGCRHLYNVARPRIEPATSSCHGWSVDHLHETLLRRREQSRRTFISPRRGHETHDLVPRRTGNLLNVQEQASRIVLSDDNRYGPGNRSHWDLSRTRFPNLIRALNMEPIMNTRKRVSSLYCGLTT